MKIYLSIVSGLMLLLGSLWLFIPEVLLRDWNVQTNEAGVYVARRYGGLVYGYAVILWLCRSGEPSIGRAAILGGSAFVTGLMAMISLWGVVSDTIGSKGWVAVVLEAGLAAGFIHYFNSERSQIKRARRARESAEQDGADQPAAAPEPSPEGKENPQSESEERPQ